MYSILVRAIVVAALIDLGLSQKWFVDCRSQKCADQIRSASSKILKIEWKPISIFPKEAKRFGA
jgi:hypothetical protein